MTDNNLKITYKGTDIVDADISTATTKTLKTSGKYCEGDIIITAQGGSGGIIPSGTINITQNGITDVTQYANANVNVPTGSTEEWLEEGVNFIDWDGTFITSWKLEDVADKTSLPTIPNHENDTFNGYNAGLKNGRWNWTLSDIKAFATRCLSCQYKTNIIVGALYGLKTNQTSTGCSIRIFFHIDEDNTKFCLGLSFNGTINYTIDDGTTVYSKRGTSSTSLTRTDELTFNRGNHVIEITSNLTSIGITQQQSCCCLFIDKNTTSADINARKYYLSGLIDCIHIGRGAYTDTIDLRQYALSYTTNMKKAMVDANKFTSTYHFYYSEIKCIVVPEDISNFYNNYTFTYSGIETISLSKVCDTISKYELQYCYSLYRISFATIKNVLSYGITNTKLENIIFLENITIESGGYNIYLNSNLKRIVFNGNIIFPASSTANNSVFASQYKLEDFIILGNIINNGAYFSSFFNGLYSVRNIPDGLLTTIPTGATVNTTSMLANCYNIESIKLPPYVTAGSTGILSSCRRLLYVEIPSGWTSMPNTTLSGCYSLKTIKFLGSTPPTATATTWYSNVPTTCKILVPSGSLSAYTSATNYPPSSTYTYEEY